jgi:hypothetical protein
VDEGEVTWERVISMMEGGAGPATTGMKRVAVRLTGFNALVQQV